MSLKRDHDQLEIDRGVLARIATQLGSDNCRLLRTLAESLLAVEAIQARCDQLMIGPDRQIAERARVWREQIGVAIQNIGAMFSGLL